MLFPRDKLQELVVALDSVIDKISEFEHRYKSQLNNVHPNYSQSAKNLVDYLAMRSFNINIFQEKLEEIGLPSVLESQNNILYGLLNFRTVINSLLNNEIFDEELKHLNNLSTQKRSIYLDEKILRVVFNIECKQAEENGYDLIFLFDKFEERYLFRGMIMT